MTRIMRSQPHSIAEPVEKPVLSLTKGIFLTILGCFFFSIMNALVKDLSTHLHPMEIAFFRSIVNVIIIAPWMISKNISLFGKRKDLLFTRSLSGFICLCLGFYAISHIKLADATILNQTSVIFVAILSVTVLHEKVTIELVNYILLGLLGATLIIKPNFNFVNLPGLMGLGAGLFGSISIIAIRQLHSTEGPYTIVFNFCFYSAIGTLLLFYNLFLLPTLPDLLRLVMLGTAGTVGQLFYTESLRHAPASMATPFTYTQVIFAGVWGALFWNEIPDAWSFLGIVLIILCGIGILRRNEMNP